MSKSLTLEEKVTSRGAFPAPLVNTVKWVGFPLSTPAQVQTVTSVLQKGEESAFSNALLTRASHSWTFYFDLGCIVGGIDFDHEGAHGNFLRARTGMSGAFISITCTAARPNQHLVVEQNFDGEPPSGGRDEFDRERVVGVGNDVKFHVGLSLADHVGVTLDAHADIT